MPGPGQPAMGNPSLGQPGMAGMMAPPMGSFFEQAKASIVMAKQLLSSKGPGLFTSQDASQIQSYLDQANTSMTQGQSTDANFYISQMTLGGLTKQVNY